MLLLLQRLPEVQVVQVNAAIDVLLLSTLIVALTFEPTIEATTIIQPGSRADSMLAFTF